MQLQQWDMGSMPSYPSQGVGVPQDFFQPFPDHAAVLPLAIAFLCIFWLFSLSFFFPLLSLFFFSFFVFFSFPLFSLALPFCCATIRQSLTARSSYWLCELLLSSNTMT